MALQESEWATAFTVVGVTWAIIALFMLMAHVSYAVDREAIAKGLCQQVAPGRGGLVWTSCPK